MIARIKGEVAALTHNSVVIDVGGIGYEVLVPAPLLSELSLGSEVQLMTHHHVRENSIDLFGFESNESKYLFELLLGVSSIGPKSALSIMALGRYDQIKQAIAAGNAAFIAGASGVGKKSAEKVCVELKDKLATTAEGELIGLADTGDDALTALLALGYNQQQAAQALAKVDPKLSNEQRVKQALRGL
ncbi:MAG TPA: Holliday junction branch migration protein RuvA [Candidatus Saccharimonadales bacterium]